MNYLSRRAKQTAFLVAFGMFLAHAQPAEAQIDPDATLGVEASTLSSGTFEGRDIQIIEGGASRGENLFHSFSDFNIAIDEGVYFANPDGIQNILSRITGSNLSNIQGLLGVDGSAHLFLINPNGILLGSEAQLDVSGSFSASTASRLTFADGSTFDAVTPEASMLTFSVPLGLQLNTSFQGDLINESNLTIGENQTLTLAGDFVVSTVHTSSPDGTTQILGNTVGLIDSESVDSAFSSNSDRFLIQATGDILIGNSLDNEMSFLSGAGQIFLAADADRDGFGNVVMLDLQDTLVTQGQSVTISGASVALGSIDASSPIDFFSFFPVEDGADGGDITISSSAGDLEVTGNLRSQVSAGNGGTVTLSSDAGNISLIGEIGTDSLSFGESGDGGAVRIASGSGDITIDADIFTNTSSSFEGGGDAGAIAITSASGNIELTGNLIAIVFSGAPAADITNPGKGGSVVVYSDSGNISINQADIATDSVLGSGGDVEIASESGDISFLGEISSRSSQIESGQVTFSPASGNLDLIGSIDSGSTFGNAGAVTLRTDSGDIMLIGDIRAAASNSAADGNAGNGGAITLLSAAGDIALAGTLEAFSFSGDGDSGSGGDVVVSAPQGSIQTAIAPGGTTGGSIVASAIAQTGTAVAGGNVTLEAADTISTLDILTSSNGDSGNITIQGTEGDLTIRNLALTTSGQVEIPDPFRPEQLIILNLSNFGQSGSALIESAGDIILNDVEIQANADGTEPAGDITLLSPSTVALNNSQINSNANSTGDAGAIRIEASRLTLGNGGRIFADTRGAGTGGSIIIEATDSVALGEGVQNFEPIISVEASGSGRSGDITISTPTFLLSETARVTAASRDTATSDQGGSITLSADQMSLAGTVGIFAETQGESPGGELTLQPYQDGENLLLTLVPGAIVSASTSGSGSGGDLVLQAPGRITIRGAGELAASTSGTGGAGNITADAQQLVLADGITLSASTSAQGAAGNILLNLSEQLIVEGSTVTSSTQPGSTGAGGNIVVSAAATTLQNGGAIAVNSDGAASGGNIRVDGNTLSLNNSRISAETRSNDGGNITFNLQDLLLLRNNSLITTEAGTAQTGGDGGDITINIAPGFVLAVPDENSDIRANAFAGDGGNVNITARNLIGTAFRPGLLDTPSSDITASSQFGSSGTVTITELDPDRLQTDTELPTDTAPPPLAQGCRAPASRISSFVSSGRGGLPTNPTDPLNDRVLWQDFSSLDALSEAALPDVSASDISTSDISNSRDEERSSESPSSEVSSGSMLSDSIVEASGWRRDRNGTPVLIAQSESSMARSSATSICETEYQKQPNEVSLEN